MGFIDKLLGRTSEQQVKKLAPLVAKINALEPSMKKLSDRELRAKTGEFRERLKKGETLDDLLPEAYAAVREAAVRTVGMRHFDVQLIGGIVLHQGRIAEMKTGEGKTLVATLPAYLNALPGEGVHVVTVNDYLASRDASWMGKIYTFLGLTVGCIVHDLDAQERRDAYNCDITYGTNTEFGFDYLRDNMAVYKASMVQRKLNYAIVDEVDSILIDEARTPLIISGRGDKSTDMYIRADRFVRRLERGADVEKKSKAELMRGEIQEESGDYMCDIKARTVALTERGMRKAEEYFNIDDISATENSELNHYIIQALKANALFTVDKDYIVSNGEVLIVDEFTGRIMLGRRYSDGLHQALEAKEGVKVQNENRTVATITYQNYFRMFAKLAGMTGTAKTEEDEFQGIYDLDVVEIPTNKPLARIDLNDEIFMNEAAKFRAVVEKIIEVNKTGQPLLVGTISVEKSEMLSDMLKKRGIKHEVLNAKHHAREAEIVAQAGKYGNVTIATNMAGRGTDILLGGNPGFLARRAMKNDGYEDERIEDATSYFDTDNEEILEARRVYREHYEKFKVVTDAEHDKVVAAGGLYIIGTERHESRRIDNQLRGRAGRQGDPGKTCFYVSMEDDLMKRFGADRMNGLMDRLSGGEDISFNFKLFSRNIESAQKRVEAHNFDIRKNVLQYDDVMNHMREIIYGQRRQVLMGEDIHDSIVHMIDEAIDSRVDLYCPAGVKSENWDLGGLIHSVKELLAIDIPSYAFASKDTGALKATIHEIADKVYAAKEEDFASHGVDMREVERVYLLRSVDEHWMDHIDAMDQLRQGIGLRAMGSKDPVVEYRNEGSDMFEEMVAGIRDKTAMMLYHVVLRQNAQPIKREQVAKPIEPMGDSKQKPKKVGAKIGPNDPCPCGSGKKYKKCCGMKQSN
ncbi:MAG: preprotein translocase subunit SecA [Clostridiales bacterium]|nr:preprotein translocase subunit SecA [Clostridiales bacterium]